MHPSSLAFSLSVAAILAAGLVPLACAQGTGSALSEGSNVGGAGGGAGGASSSSTGGQGGAPDPGQGGAAPSSPCDGTGDCPGCQTCAQTTEVCSSLYNECMSSFRCMGVVNCWGSCGGDPSCQQFCLQSNQQGAMLFVALADCAVCACVADCAIDPTQCQ